MHSARPQDTPPHTPLVHEIAWLAPFEAAARLRAQGGLTFLDSAMRHPMLGRYSYVAIDPFGRFAVRAGQAFWNDAPVAGHPLTALSELLARFRQDRMPGMPPFQGGAAGYFAYEFGRSLERLPKTAAPPYGAIDDATLGFYDVVLAFDHETQRAFIVSSGHPEENPQARALRARARVDDVQRLIETPSPDAFAARAASALAWRSNFSRDSYKAAVGEVIEAILAGDIFQANIAQRFIATVPPDADPFAFYLQLRQDNPAPFAAFLDCGDVAIASSSPERFVSVTEGRVETRPIKGTAPRAADPVEDRRRADALLASEKDRAENLMIVDLLRNDLSRVCRSHSVETPALCALESYAGVHHLVSAVTGELTRGKTALDLIAAAFPGGSVTGAPKVRAMEIIAQIEREQRGVYCGSIGFFGFDGTCDTSIAIRTVVFAQGMAAFQVGGGVTALSDPQAEYNETLDKAERLFRAFGQGKEDEAG